MNAKKELPLILLVLLPFFYLGYIWNSLPTSVPMHWNINGEIDRYGSKAELIIIPILLPLLSYVLFSVIPQIDPKNNFSKMGFKYQKFKSIIIAFMSVLAMYILYSAKTASLGNPNFVEILIGILYIIVGNYFKTIKPNYFIGIRTPWTLENVDVWKKTHEFGGKLWFSGGLLMVILSLILPPKINIVVFFVIIFLTSLVPIVYSYLQYKVIKNQKN